MTTATVGSEARTMTDESAFKCTYSLESQLEGCSEIRVKLNANRKGDFLRYRFEFGSGPMPRDERFIDAMTILRDCRFHTNPVGYAINPDNNLELRVFYANSATKGNGREEEMQCDMLADAMRRLSERLHFICDELDSAWRQDPQTHFIVKR